VKKKPKILFYDIENSPNTAYVWDKYEQNVIAYDREWEMLSFAYKWQGSNKVTCVTREGEKTDKELTRKLHKLFREADLLVAHNGDSFDQRKAKARMIFHGMSPPKVLQSVDTKKVAKTYFRFNGNGLDELGEHLGLGRKLKHQGFDLWLGCMKDDPKAWRTMARYNKQDVVLLEKVYDKFLPWIQNHPSIAKLNDPRDPTLGCPNCGSKNFYKRGLRATHVQVMQQYQCNDCTSWFVGKLGKKR
jgi:DNA polymerase elongation subunit (family B)